MASVTQDLSEEKLELLPTAEDVDFYQQHGWYISPQVISDEVIAQAIDGSQRFYQGERDMQLPVSSGYSNWQSEDGFDVVRNNEFVSLQNRELRQLALQPIIGAIAARLTQTNQIRLLDDQLVYKPPSPDGSGYVGWHADAAYWATCSSSNLITAWIPFQDCTLANAPLVVLDGSHKWSDMNNTRFFNHQNLEEMEHKFHQPGRQIVRVPMTLKKGQVSFHHCWTIHGSYPNRSNLPRLALAVHLQDAVNQYQPFWNHKGEEIHMFDELLCQKLPNGNPDFSDPAVFPALWSSQS